MAMQVASSTTALAGPPLVSARGDRTTQDLALQSSRLISAEHQHTTTVYYHTPQDHYHVMHC